MARVFQWTNDTPLGFMNQEADALWTDVDANTAAAVVQLAESDTMTESLLPMSFRTSSSYSSIYVYPVIVAATGVDTSLWGTAGKPTYWANGGDLQLDTYWSANNTTGSQVVTIENKLNGYRLGQDGSNNLIAQAHQDITLPTTAFELFKVSFSAASITTLGDTVFYGVQLRRLGTDPADTYANDIYFVGATLTYTP
jgi:hypothetical protein